jgi:hypothetical protein
MGQPGTANPGRVVEQYPRSGAPLMPQGLPISKEIVIRALRMRQQLLTSNRSVEDLGETVSRR